MSRLMQMVLLESVDSWSQFPPQYDIGAAQLGPNCQVSTCNAPRCHDVEHLQDPWWGRVFNSFPDTRFDASAPRAPPSHGPRPVAHSLPKRLGLHFRSHYGSCLACKSDAGLRDQADCREEKATPRTSLAASFSEPHPTFSTLDTRDHTELCVVARKSPV